MACLGRQPERQVQEYDCVMGRVNNQRWPTCPFTAGHAGELESEAYDCIVSCVKMSKLDLYVSIWIDLQILR